MEAFKDAAELTSCENILLKTRLWRVRLGNIGEQDKNKIEGQVSLIWPLRPRLA